MALATEVLKQQLKSGILNALNKPIDENMSDGDVKERLASSLAETISSCVDTWIKTGTVTVQAGIPVSTAGSPTAQTGATTGPGTGTIS